MCVCVCVCVCVYRDGLLLRTSPEDMVSVLHTNLLGTMLTCKAALRGMLHSQHPAIVNIGDNSILTMYCCSNCPNTATRGQCVSTYLPPLIPLSLLAEFLYVENCYFSGHGEKKCSNGSNIVVI